MPSDKKDLLILNKHSSIVLSWYSSYSVRKQQVVSKLGDPENTENNMSLIASPS